MEGIREYLVSVTAAALLCGIIRSLAGEKGGSGGLLRLICGIFLALTVIRPLKELDLSNIPILPADLMAEAQSVSAQGAEYTREASELIIKQRCEAYVLDKARELEAQIRVEIELSREGDPIPVSSRVTGELSPYAKGKLSSILKTDLGIPEEDQQWNR